MWNEMVFIEKTLPNTDYDDEWKKDKIKIYNFFICSLSTLLNVDIRLVG